MSEGVNVSSDGEVTHILTPDEASDLNSRVIGIIVANQERVRKLFRRWVIIASVVLALGVGYVSWTSHQIRATQITNTKTNSCTAKALDHLDADLILAVVSHDANPADYKALVKC